MKAYKDLLLHILDTGTWKGNRTGTRTLMIPTASLAFDVGAGDWPVLTTKKIFWRSFAGEIVAFLRGATSAAEFRALGCNFWDANANETMAWVENPFRNGTDDLGMGIYGCGWRHWPAYYTLRHDENNVEARRAALLEWGYSDIATTHDGAATIFYREIDQIADCVRTLLTNPHDRRIRFTSWNPATLRMVSLPACHTTYGLMTNGDATELSMSVSCRSTDVGLGLPGNLVGGCILLSLIAHLVGMKPRILRWNGDDVHVYENHLDMIHEQLGREPFDRPTVRISDRIPCLRGTDGAEAAHWLSSVEPSDFLLENYVCHPAIKAPMAA